MSWFPEKTIIFTIFIMMFQVRKASEQIVGHVCLTSLYLRTANRCSASTSALFIWLIIRLIRLVFSAGTIFFSHKKSANSVFQPAYNSSRTGPISPTLKTLVIDGGSNTDACVLVILAPALAYLHLAVDVYKFRGGVSLNEVPSIAKAFIHLWHHKYNYDRSKLEGEQFKLLCSISNSTNFKLSGVGTRVCLCCLLQCSILFTPIMLWYYLTYYRCLVRNPDSKNSRT
jgi:hypothetical protein